MEHDPNWERALVIRLREPQPERKKPVLFIPNEILHMIINNFRLPVNKVTDGMPPEEFLVNRTTLYNICLTASFLIKFTRPLLYETIILYLGSKPDENERVGNQRTMVLLIRTLLEEPDFCPLIKNIICPSIITKFPWISKFHDYSKDFLLWPFVQYDYPP
ncbi:uncharacterized protein GGS22DRAFT_68542 [Annulohypoxylon maeteangense]|uniref:uncharacterized protein n=1 Tax=Annulohypoxylon maeteangense TaxID=1927788 RepID=UPI002007B3EB|nr:uncharacterized protein GGS22DRAFT_68542 [Annulohypoxylon maeteangense]KAI0889197.1 hypothetical protein GGS22DRAFT_68542 [Annulohypoxylon maeteangense]